MVVNDVVAGDLGQEDGGVPAHMTGRVLGSVGIIFKQKYQKCKSSPGWIMNTEYD